MTIEIVLLGTGNPLPDRDRAGAATLVRAGGSTLLVDAGRAVCMRLAAAGVLPFMLDAVLHHAPAQRSHLRSQRRGHDALGDEPGREVVADLRAAANERGRRRNARDAAARRRVPHRASRGPDVGARDRCRRGGARRRLRRERRARHRRRAPITGRRNRPSASGSSTTARRSCSRATPCRAPGLDELCARCRRLRADRVARRPRAAGADAALPRHDRLPLHGRAGRADRGTRWGAHARVDPPDPDARPRRGRRVDRHRA